MYNQGMENKTIIAVLEADFGMEVRELYRVTSDDMLEVACHEFMEEIVDELEMNGISDAFMDSIVLDWITNYSRIGV